MEALNLLPTALFMMACEIQGELEAIVPLDVLVRVKCLGVVAVGRGRKRRKALNSQPNFVTHFATAKK